MLTKQFVLLYNNNMNDELKIALLNRLNEPSNLTWNGWYKVEKDEERSLFLSLCDEKLASHAYFNFNELLIRIGWEGRKFLSRY